MQDMGVPGGNQAGYRLGAGDAPGPGRRLLHEGTWEATAGVQSCRDRQSWRSRNAAHPRRQGSFGGNGTRVETVALYTDPTATRPSCGRQTSPTRWAPPRPVPTSTTPSWNARWWSPAPTPPGSAGGFVAEDPAFAELCERIGVTFVGPSAEAMRRLGDKIGAKLLAEEVASRSRRGAAARSPHWRTRCAPATRSATR